MVHSSTPAVATNRERLTCSGFSLGETVHFESLEFMVDCFNALSLSPKGSDLGTVFVGSTCNRSPSLQATIEDFTEEFYIASSGDVSATQAMMTVPLEMLAPRPEAGLPLE
jgi:hypothetical protein